jgi:CO/xanthine dehydrogenase Mo-binding subunit
VGGAARQAGVLRAAATRADWGGALPADSGLGVATSFGQERDMPTWVACVARVRVDRPTGTVTVEKLSVVVDAGTIVDPGSALAQTEGGALWGLSMALHEGTAFLNGQVRDTNLVPTVIDSAAEPRLDGTATTEPIRGPQTDRRKEIRGETQR